MTKTDHSEEPSAWSFEDGISSGWPSSWADNVEEAAAAAGPERRGLHAPERFMAEPVIGADLATPVARQRTRTGADSARRSQSGAHRPSCAPTGAERVDVPCPGLPSTATWTR
jgi:hypothetical protein